MNKTFHFMAGLPRSGSTVLSAILNQNPTVYSSPQTELLDLLYNIQTSVPTFESYKAGLLHTSYNRVIECIPQSFYDPIDKPVVIDKNRSWGTPYNWTNLSPYVNPDGKVILTIRPILEVLASFVKIAKDTESITGDLPYLNNDLWVTHYRNESDAMVDNLMTTNGSIDGAIYSIANLLKNYGDRVYLVWFDDLITQPQSTLNGIYDFLNLDRFEHNFQSIIQQDKHNDYEGYGIVGLHDIKSSIVKSETDVDKYLSNYAIEKYKNALDFLWA
jgi:sulfotransferase